MTQRTIPQMINRGRGHIVNISTSLVDHADSTRPAALPALTKGGLVAVTRSLAIEYASRGVRVNAVSLGVIQTPGHDPLSYAKLGGLHPLGRVGEVADVVRGCSIRAGRSSPGDAAHRRRAGGRALMLLSGDKPLTPGDGGVDHDGTRWRPRASCRRVGSRVAVWPFRSRGACRGLRGRRAPRRRDRTP